MNKKIVIAITIVLSALLVIGSTFSLWRWVSNRNLVMVNIITASSSGIGLTFDGGGASNPYIIK